MSTAPRPTGRSEPSRIIPYAVRVTLEAEDYDQLLALARRDYRKVEWQASFLLRQAILAATREDDADAR